MEYQKISRADLLPIIKTSSEGVTEAEFVARYITSVARLLEKDPARYRAYGVYWWPLKKELVAGGFLQFGEELHDGWLEMLDYGVAALNVTAAYVYSSESWSQGRQYSNQHYVLDADGDPIPAVLEDAEMESVINAVKLA